MRVLLICLVGKMVRMVFEKIVGKKVPPEWMGLCGKDTCFLNQLLLARNWTGCDGIVTDFPFGRSEVELGLVQSPIEAHLASCVGGHATDDGSEC